MKRFLTVFAALAAVACTKALDEPVAIEQVPIDGPKMVVTEVIGSIESEQTKTSFDYDDLNNIVTFWMKNDAIIVTDGSSTAIFTASKNDYCKNSPFTGSGSFKADAEALYALYPSNAEVENGKLNFNIPSKQNDSNWASQDVKLGVCKNPQVSTPVFKFNNLTSLLKIRMMLAEGAEFKANEYLRDITITAPEGTAISGPFCVSLDSENNVNSRGASNKVVYEYESEDVQLDSYNVTEAYVNIAPCTVSTSLTISIRTNLRKFSRSINLGGATLKANTYYNFNLLSISDSDPKYTVSEYFETIEIDESTIEVEGTKVTVPFDDVIYQQTGSYAHRYYTAQLRKKGESTNVIDRCDFQSTYSTVYSVGAKEEVYLPAGLTYSGLEENTQYETRFKANVEGIDADWSEWASFTTQASQYTDTDAQKFLDFTDVKGYGWGDVIGHVPSTFPGATYVESAYNKDAGYKDWCDRLNQVDGTSTAAYRVADDVAMMAINSDNPFNQSIRGVSSCTRVFGRPGYISLGTTSNKGELVIPVTRTSQLARKTKPQYTVSFDACPYNTDNAASVTVALTVTYDNIVYNDLTGSSTISIPANREHSLSNYSAVITAKDSWLVATTPTSVTITITSDGSTRVLIDNLKITKKK